MPVSRAYRRSTTPTLDCRASAARVALEPASALGLLSGGASAALTVCQERSGVPRAVPKSAEFFFGNGVERYKEIRNALCQTAEREFIEPKAACEPLWILDAVGSKG